MYLTDYQAKYTCMSISIATDFIYLFYYINHYCLTNILLTLTVYLSDSTRVSYYIRIYYILDKKSVESERIFQICIFIET
jgi:hypothetical protein